MSAWAPTSKSVLACKSRSNRNSRVQVFAPITPWEDIAGSSNKRLRRELLLSRELPHSSRAAGIDRHTLATASMGSEEFLPFPQHSLTAKEANVYNIAGEYHDHSKTEIKNTHVTRTHGKGLDRKSLRNL